MNEITFIEGSVHVVTIPIVGIDLTGKKASIQVRREQSDALLFNFKTDDATLNIAGQTIVLAFPPSLSVGKSGKAKWQLKIYTDDSDAVKFEPYDLNITKAINQP